MAETVTAVGAGVDPMTPALYRVGDRREETADTVTVDLVPLERAIPTPDPGQFTMLWPFGVGEVPISVASIAAPPSPTEGAATLTQTIRQVGKVTAALCRLEPGAVVGVRGPFGTGWDTEGARGGDVLVVAGGLGVAPVRPIVEAMLADRDRYGRLVVLVGARTPDDLLYRDLLDDWSHRTDLDLAVTVDRAPATWRGDVGLVTRLIDRARVDLERLTAFVCGPEIMMRAVARHLLDRGVPPARIGVSLERNMHCGVGHCGHCQLGPLLLCLDGPVVPWTVAAPLLAVPER